MGSSFDHFLLDQHRKIVKSHPFNAASLYQESHNLTAKSGTKRDSCEEKIIPRSSKRQAIQYTVGARSSDYDTSYLRNDSIFETEIAAKSSLGIYENSKEIIDQVSSRLI